MLRVLGELAIWKLPWPAETVAGLGVGDGEMVANGVRVTTAVLGGISFVTLVVGDTVGLGGRGVPKSWTTKIPSSS